MVRSLIPGRNGSVGKHDSPIPGRNEGVVMVRSLIPARNGSNELLSDPIAGRNETVALVGGLLPHGKKPWTS